MSAQLLHHIPGLDWITLPGAAARRRLLVSGTTTVVAVRLALKLSP
jgi:hypothetical protein